MTRHNRDVKNEKRDKKDVARNSACFLHRSWFPLSQWDLSWITLAMMKRTIKGTGLCQLTSLLDEFTRVVNDQDQHRKEHKKSIKDIDVHLFRINISCPRSAKLNRSNQVTNHHGETSDVHRPHIWRPFHIGVHHNQRRGCFFQTKMELDCNENEKCKDNQREDQACQHNFLSNAHNLRISSNLDTSTAKLSAKTENIVHHKDECEPLGPHAGKILCFERTYDSPEDHVNRCSDERWCAENEHFLKSPWTNLETRLMRPCSSIVSECLAWLLLLG